MICYNFLDNFKIDERISLAIGGFDAIHEGHINILKKVNSVLYFRTLPQQILNNDFLGTIRSHRQRLNLFEKIGIKHAIAIDFSNDFSTISGDKFLNILNNKFIFKKIVTGDCFAFGYQRQYSGVNIATWAFANGIEYNNYTLYKVANSKVSSTLIRRLIFSGNIEYANSLLASNPYSIDVENVCYIHQEGYVIYNLSCSMQVLPPDGSYLCSSGIVNIKCKKLYSKQICNEFIFIKRQ